QEENMIRIVETFTMTVMSLALYCSAARAQAPAATLKVELQNVVYYLVDTSDISKFGTNPNITPNTRIGCFLLGITDVACLTIQQKDDGAMQSMHLNRTTPGTLLLLFALTAVGAPFAIAQPLGTFTPT